MKTVTLKTLDEPISINEIDISNQIVAYKQQGSASNRWSYGILNRLNTNFRYDDVDRFGFSSLYYSITAAPTYAAKTWQECVIKCAKNRDVKVFDSVPDLLNAILNRNF